MSTEKFLYYNRPQLIAYLVSANKEYHILGRGTGKTSGILARKSVQNIFALPRASGVNIGSSFSQQLTRTLPSLIAGWEMLGYKRDVHYVIGRRPDKRLRWKDPLEPPIKRDYFFHWFNGSGMHLGSQDVDGSTIGMNVQWIQGDEAKKLNAQKLNEETRPAMRGYKHLFGNRSEYRSECYTTSMPMKASEKWILAEREKMDKEVVKLILQMELSVNGLKAKMIDCDERDFMLHKNKVIQLERALNELRKTCVFYQEASSLENFAILGKDYFDDLYRNLPPIIFDTEILNLRTNKIEGGFYPTFNIDLHTYRPSYHNTYLESLNYDLDLIKNIDCRQDGDCIGSEPLIIAIDWGGHMNYMSIAQEIGLDYRFINELWVKHPEHIDHLAEKFANYYLPHFNKDIIFLQDVTGDNIKDNSAETSAEQFMRKVKAINKGFNFIKKDREAAPTHEDKYKLGYRAFLRQDFGYPRISINEDKCENLIISISNAPLKEDINKGIKKDKSSEKKWETIDPLHATHPSDTLDMHINHTWGSLIDTRGDYIGD